MPAIKASSIRDLKDRIGIYDVVSREVSLKRAGTNYKGLSPFTNEKTPSFFISPDKGFYKCFSSGNAGDIISFVMETERLSFVEAVETLASRFSIELEYEDGGHPREDRTLRQELFDLHDFVAAYYHDAFKSNNADGDWIRDYWTEVRAFSLSVADDFKIGYAPPSGVELGRRIIKKGYSKQAIEASGLFYTRRGFTPESMGYRFRGRLMIPIRDHQGRISAFTARQLERTPTDDPSREAKYVNSPETPLFNKGSILFNMDRARKEVGPETPFVMVEGQLDAIRCWTAGLKGAVAPQGTGITESQLRLVKRYEPRLQCVLDGDRAGRQAAMRMLPMALAQGIEISFIPLSDGGDPDDVLKSAGESGVANLLEGEMDAISFAIQTLAPDIASLSPQAKAKTATEVFEIIVKTDSETAQFEFLKLVADRLEIDPRAALRDFERYKRRQNDRQASGRARPNVQNEPITRKNVHTVERDLLALCLNEEGIGRELAQRIDESWIDTGSPEGELLNLVLNAILHDMWNGPDSVNDQIDKTELRTLAVDLVFEKPDYENPIRLANEALNRLAVKYADNQIKKIKLEIAQKQSEQDRDSISLFDEIVKLQHIKNNPPRIG